MEEKSAFDILVENLSEFGLTPQTHITNQTFIVPGGGRFLNTKFVFVEIDSLYFVAYDTYSTKAHTSNTFTGIYSTIDLPTNMECKIYKKHSWLDFFLYVKKRKAGVRYIDDKLTIVGSSKDMPISNLSANSVDLFLRLNDKKTPPFQLIIQNDYLPMINPLKEKKIVGVEIREWIYLKPDLMSLIDNGQKLIRNIKSELVK